MEKPGPLTCVEEHNPINIRRSSISYHAEQLQSGIIKLSSVELEWNYNLIKAYLCKQMPSCLPGPEHHCNSTFEK